MRKAFTLIELVVALGILAVVLAFAGVIFRVSVGAQQAAAANAEIMQKLRAITEQLDDDFRGILPAYGCWLDTRTVQDVNSDSLAFLASGDFQSTRQDNNGQTIVGNVAAVFYGPPDPNSYTQVAPPRSRLLLRRQTILAPGVAAPTDSSGQNVDWREAEYWPVSLEQWRIKHPFTNAADWNKRTVVDPSKLQIQLPMYLAKGVDSFTISYLEAETSLQTGTIPWKRTANNRKTFSASDFPRAFKFEFTLYDSKGIIKGGSTFSHIVFLDR